mmetsp:Transcript_4049/g.5592  ORF Transcript_4049/g.5592 Transcript_4049/m.5592 type:complete len:170 (-) Transcript_4049:71-580(-)
MLSSFYRHITTKSIRKNIFRSGWQCFSSDNCPDTQEKLLELAKRVAALSTEENKIMHQLYVKRVGFANKEYELIIRFKKDEEGSSFDGNKPPAEPEKEKNSFDVKLVGYDPTSKLKVIKEVRAITGLGLKEAKDMVEGIPKLLKKDLLKEEAEELVKKITDLGGKCTME